MKRKIWDAHLLRVKMTEADIGTNELARRLETYATVVSEWRRGKEPRDVEQVADIAKVLGCNVEDFYSEVEP